MRERKKKLEAELAARIDLAPEDARKLAAAHAKELAGLAEKLNAEKTRQGLKLSEELNRRRQQKLLEVRKRQDLRKRQVCGNGNQSVMVID